MIDIIILVIFASFCNAGFVELFDFCIQPNNIFQRYGKWLNEKAIEFQMFYRIDLDSETYSDRIFWLKAAGYCKYCFQVWFSFLTYPVIVHFIQVFTIHEPTILVNIALLIGYTSLSHIVLYNTGS